MTFEDAKRQFVHRFTMEHKPAWARFPCNHRFYAPQYRTDREWFDNTKFPGDEGYPYGECETDCYSTGQTWPLGQWLDEEFQP